MLRDAPAIAGVFLCIALAAVLALLLEMAWFAPRRIADKLRTA